MILSQKALNRAINERMSTLTDDEVFLSEAYRHRLTQMSTGVLQADRGKTVTIAGDPGITAYTDGSTRTINLRFELVQKQPDREAKDKFMRGFNLHETAHCLLTDFALHKKFMEKLMKEHKFLCEPYANPYKEMTEKGIEKANVAMIFHNLDNSLEDGFINRAVQTAAPGYYEDLLFVLDQFAVMEKFSYKEESQKFPKALLFSNMVLLYAVYGLKAYEVGEVLGNPLLSLFEEAIPWIDKTVVEAEPEKRKRCVATVFCHLYRAIMMDWEEQKKEKKEKQGQQSQQGQQGQNSQSGNDNGNSGESSSDDSRENTDGAKEGKTKASENASDNAESNKGEGKGNDAAGKDDAENGSNGEEKGSCEGNDGSSPENASNGQENAQNGSSGSPSDGDGQEGGASGAMEMPSDPSEQSQEGKSGSAGSPDPGANGSPAGGTMEPGKEPSAEELQKLTEALERDMHSSEQADHSDAQNKANKEAIEALKKAQGDPSARNEESPAQDDVEKLAKELAEKELQEKQEEEIQKQLQEATAEISKESMHRKIPCRVIRLERNTWSDTLYETEKGNLDTVVKRLSREFLKEIKERQTGDTMTGLYNGKSLDVNHLYRDDKRIFSQKILPEDIPDMAVGILVDCSGSMRGNTRIENARRCAYVTYEFCKELRIPCFVFGHTTSGQSVVMYSVADESSLDKDESKRIFCLNAGGSNRDGYALRYCLKKLEKIDAKDRLMLIISD